MGVKCHFKPQKSKKTKPSDAESLCDVAQRANPYLSAKKKKTEHPNGYSVFFVKEQ